MERFSQEDLTEALKHAGIDEHGVNVEDVARGVKHHLDKPQQVQKPGRGR